MQFDFASQIDWTAVAAEFAEHRRLRLEQVLPVETIRALLKTADQEVVYGQAFVDGSGSREISLNEFRGLTPQQRQQLVNAVYGQAARGIGFWYGRHAIGKSSPGLVAAFLDWINSETVLNQIRRLDGADDVQSASGQLSRFMPGDFLTRHTDDVGEEGRRVAYVMNLSEAWHPDWGGLLQFFHLDGRPRDAWSPLFNSLCLFDVRQVHSVTCVAPFAPRPRLAISGWFRTRPRPA